MQNISLKTWWMAFRPKTLTAAIAPVLIGTGLAYGDGIHHFPTAILCLLGALLIQIGTNLANDYFDFKKGTDDHERIGPIRVTQAGLIKPETVRLSFIITFSLAGLIALILIQRGGLPIALIAIASILSGIFYTAGPKPLGYLGLGEIFALIFFGPVAVAGTYYVQSYEINMAIILAGFAPGFFSVAILSINNLRDIEGDHRSGKKTLAVRFGDYFARCEYIFSVLCAALIPVLIYGIIRDHVLILLSSLVCFMAIPAFITVSSRSDGMSLNETLAYTGKILIVYSILFSIGWLS